MSSTISRTLFAASAAVFALGGVMHAVAYEMSASGRITKSNLPSFVVSELKVLWLADTTTLMALSLLFGFLAVWPAAMTKPAVMLVAGIPAGTTFLLYLFLGPFYAAHLLLSACAMTLAGALLMPARREGH